MTQVAQLPSGRDGKGDDYGIDDVFLTVKEVASFCKMREATVRLWIRNGDLRAVKFGREWRVSKNDLQAFTESRKSNI